VGTYRLTAHCSKRRNHNPRPLFATQESLHCLRHGSLPLSLNWEDSAAFRASPLHIRLLPPSVIKLLDGMVSNYAVLSGPHSPHLYGVDKSKKWDL